MVDRRHLHVQSLTNAGRDGYMPCVGHTDLIGRIRKGRKFNAAETWVDLDEIVSGSLLLTYLALCIRGTGYGPAVQRRSRRDEPWAEHFTACQLLAQGQVTRLTQHAANGGDPIGDEQC